MKIKELKSVRLAVLSGVLVAVLAGGYVGLWRPQAQLSELAQDTCAELNGAVVFQAGPILGKAVSRAERLGFTGPELGEQMREHCAEIMAGIDRLAAGN